MSDYENQYKSLDELKQHPLWKDLTEKQQVFVAKYIETNGDRVESVRAAFNVTSDGSAATIASKLLRRYNVRTLLGLYFGYEVKGGPGISRTELIGLITKRLRNPNVGVREFASLTWLVAQLKGWAEKRTAGRPRKQDAEEPEETIVPESDVFALVRKLEQERGK